MSTVRNAFLWASLLVVVLAAGSGLTWGADVDPAAQSVLTSLLSAVLNNDYDAFVSNGTPEFKAALAKQMFEGVSAQVAPRLKGGYSPQFLGDLRQQGLRVYLWKLTFTDGTDDVLAKLVLKEDKVAGFWLQ